MADALSSDGARPVAAIASRWVVQLVLEAIRAPVELCNSSIGFVMASAMPALTREGPIPRRRIFFGVVPEMMKPPIITLLPERIEVRVETLIKLFSPEGGVGVGVGVAVGVGVGVEPGTK